MFKASKGVRSVRFSGKVAAIEFALREDADKVVDANTGEVVWRRGDTTDIKPALSRLPLDF